MFLESQSFSFGPFVLTPARQELLRGGSPVHLGARALEILTVLVQRPGTVIAKQELMSLVRTDTFVDDSNLKVHIAALRKALDEGRSHSSCIATAIGRGDRFVEPVLPSSTTRQPCTIG
jgi:DNA-binding winged helix-turn-helix (wHTH) protein